MNDNHVSASLFRTSECARGIRPIDAGDSPEPQRARPQGVFVVMGIGARFFFPRRLRVVMEENLRKMRRGLCTLSHEMTMLLMVAKSSCAFSMMNLRKAAEVDT